MLGLSDNSTYVPKAMEVGVGVFVLSLATDLAKRHITKIVIIILVCFKDCRSFIFLKIFLIFKYSVYKYERIL